MKHCLRQQLVYDKIDKEFGVLLSDNGTTVLIETEWHNKALRTNKEVVIYINILIENFLSWRTVLTYGARVEGLKRIYFNRDYETLWVREENGKWSLDFVGERVKLTAQSYYFYDSTFFNKGKFDFDRYYNVYEQWHKNLLKSD